MPGRTAQSVSSVFRAVAWSAGLHLVALSLVALLTSRSGTGVPRLSRAELISDIFLDKLRFDSGVDYVVELEG